MSDDKVPFTLFSTAGLARAEQFDAWHASVGVVFDTSPLDRHAARDGFAATVRAWNLGELMVSEISFEGQHFARDRRRLMADGLDHYLVQLYDKGGLVGSAAERERVLRAGDMQILDLARANRTRAEASDTVSVILPRRSLERAFAGPRDLHGVTLRRDTGAGSLLGDYLRSVSRRADLIERRDCIALGKVTTQMIAACFLSTAESIERASVAIDMTLFEQARTCISANLRSPQLGPASICRQLRISRARLYRLFGDLGGVAAYIQDQRLRAAYAELANPLLARRRIYDVAYDLGFASEAHFSRVFRRAFDVKPSDVRHDAVLSGQRSSTRSPKSPGERGYDEWIRQLQAAPA